MGRAQRTAEVERVRAAQQEMLVRLALSRTLEDRGLDPSTIGLVIATPAVVRIFVTPLVAHQADRYRALKAALAIGVDTPKVTRYALAKDVVRYAGEWVAAVVADTRALAEDAAELIEVEYDELTPLLDPEAAVQDGSTVLHPDLLSYKGLPVPVEKTCCSVGAPACTSRASAR